MSVSPGPSIALRDRRRAQTVAEIKEAALRELVDAGPGGFSLRGVARSVGMTVQSLYHYFANRDALLSALVVDAHHSAADMVEAAAEASRGRHPHERRLAACRAFREWALANRPAFLLLYGTPVPGFTPLADLQLDSGKPLPPSFVIKLWSALGRFLDELHQTGALAVCDHAAAWFLKAPGKKSLTEARSTGLTYHADRGVTGVAVAVTGITLAGYLWAKWRYERATA